MSRPPTMLVMSDDARTVLFGPAELERLRALAELGDLWATVELGSPEVRARLAEVEVLITSWGCPPLDAAVLAAAPRLRAVLHAAGSVRGHVGDAVYERGLLVTTAAGANAEPVARYTLAAILWAHKKVPFLAADARLHRAFRAPRGEVSGHDRTVVLVGFSRIGQRVAQLLQAVGGAGRILVVDPVVDPTRLRAAGVEPATLVEALPVADVLSLHAPLLPSTRDMIGAAELAALPDGATLINTARGGLVEQSALERACGTGRIHAVLDVSEPEPLPATSPLYDMPNVVLTPHVAGSTGSETRALAGAALDELERFAAGLPPLDQVLPEDLLVQA